MKKRSRKHLASDSSHVGDVVNATSVRVKTSSGRVSMRKLKGTARGSQKSSQVGPSTIQAAPGVADLQGRQRPFSPLFCYGLYTINAFVGHPGDNFTVPFDPGDDSNQGKPSQDPLL